LLIREKPRSAGGKYANPMRGLILWPAYVGCRPGEGLRIERETHIDVKTNRIEIVGQKYPDGSPGQRRTAGRGR
jgi:hypothetical protein